MTKDDLISRQAAIDALRDAENHAFNSFYKGLAKAHKIIADLPSVQPDHTADIGKKVDGDCISRQVAIDAYGDWYVEEGTEEGFIGTVKQLLEGLPSAQPATNCSEIPNSSDDTISRQAAIDAMKDMYRAAEKWLRDATDDVTKARAESCMASLVEIKLRTEKLSAVQPEQCEWIPKEVENVPYGLIVECSKCGCSELIDNALYHKYCPNCGRKVITE